MSLADELEKLAGEATSAPWDFTWHEDEIELFDAREAEDGSLYPGCDELYVYSKGASLKSKRADFALIVALRNNLDTILSALRERDAVWQPIKTAPKHGVPVWVADLQSMCVAYWVDDWRNWFKGCDYSQPSDSPLFKPETIWFTPTHWRPLPALPAGQHMKGEGE